MLKKYKTISVVGSRHYTDKKRVYYELDELRKIAPFITTIVSGIGEDKKGNGKGADLFAREYARDRKLKYKGYEPDWQDMAEPCVVRRNEYGTFNALAGIKRNTQIVSDGDFIMIFWDGVSPGTKDSHAKTIQQGKPYKLIKF